jgi:hypothetical protein
VAEVMLVVAEVLVVAVYRTRTDELLSFWSWYRNYNVAV